MRMPDRLDRRAHVSTSRSWAFTARAHDRTRPTSTRRFVVVSGAPNGGLWVLKTYKPGRGVGWGLLGKAELAGAGGPGAVTTAAVADEGGDRDLLLPGGQVGASGVLRATVGVPGADVELQAAVVPVAGVDRPVAA